MLLPEIGHNINEEWNINNSIFYIYILIYDDNQELLLLCNIV